MVKNSCSRIRNKWATRIIVILCGILIASLLGAISDDGGVPGAFLRLGVGARPLGLGNAFVALANDVSATYWNPAGLTQLNQIASQAMYGHLPLGRNHSFVAFGLPSKIGSFGACWINLGITGIEGRDIGENPTQIFSSAENAIFLSYGKHIISDISLGASFKYLYNSLATKSAHGYGFDLGVQARLSDVISAGLILQDIGSFLKWNTESKHKDKLPLNLKLGLGMMPSAVPIQVAFDLEKNAHQALRYHLGLEYWFPKTLGIRAGCDNGDIVAGFSFRELIASYQLQLDYSFSTDRIGGLIHRVSLLLSV
jgi:hypothetical protein